MAFVYDKSRLWLHVLDKLLDGGAQSRGSVDLIRYVDNLVGAYEQRFVRKAAAEAPSDEHQPKKQPSKEEMEALKKDIAARR